MALSILTRMKEITSYQGGRYRYCEDINSLQDAALAITEFFKQFDGNFVISGCENNGAGYVWINGKIRHVDAASPSMHFDYIIAEDSNGVSIDYSNDEKHEMNKVYSAKYSTVASSSANMIAVNSKISDFPRIWYAIFHKCSIDKSSTLDSVVTSPMNFSGSLIGKTMTFKVGDSSIDLRINYPYLDITFTINGKNNILRLPFEKNTIKYTTSNNEWSLSNKDEDINGELFFDSVNIDELEVKEAVKCDDLLVKTANGEYSSIANILTINDKNESRVSKVYNSITNLPINTLDIRESNGIVNISGIIPASYIFGYDVEGNCHVGGSFSINENQNNDFKITKESKEYCFKYKTSMKLGAGITPPNKNRLPGIILYPTMSSYNWGSGSVANGNIQLMMDEKGCFYYLTNGYNSSFYFMIDRRTLPDGSQIVGIPVNLTYLV